jgi:hypothetical protein
MLALTQPSSTHSEKRLSKASMMAFDAAVEEYYAALKQGRQ